MTRPISALSLFGGQSR